jgi:hypothetical protein
MPKHEVSNDPTKHELDEDWEGNNVAFTCPLCKKVFIVSAHLLSTAASGYVPSAESLRVMLRVAARVAVVRGLSG